MWVRSAAAFGPRSSTPSPPARSAATTRAGLGVRNGLRHSIRSRSDSMFTVLTSSPCRGGEKGIQLGLLLTGTVTTRSPYAQTRCGVERRMKLSHIRNLTNEPGWRGVLLQFADGATCYG